MSSPRQNSITIVKKKEKSSFGLPLSTIGKKQGAKMAASTSPRREPRGDAQSLILGSPAGSPPSSPRAQPRISDLDEHSFHEFVAESMTRISTIPEAERRRSELAALQATANEYTKRLVTAKERAEEEERLQKAAAEAAEKAEKSHRKKKNVSSTQLSRISDNDVLAYEKALKENKRLKEEEEAKREALKQEEAEREALLKDRFCVGDLVYAEFEEDQLWYLARVLAVDGCGGARVEFVEYGGEAQCGPEQLELRVAEGEPGEECGEQCDDAAPPKETETLPGRRRGDSQWLAGIDRNLGSRFSGGEGGAARARGNVARALGAVARMCEQRPDAHAAFHDGVSDSE